MSSSPIEKPQPAPRSAYKLFRTLGTRWMDNDAYGHVNNVVYYSWFDTAVNAYLIEQGVLDIERGAIIGLVVETQCNYFAPLAFPQTVEAGLRVALSAARGHFVHVYVDRQSRRPTPLPINFKTALEVLL
jgi:acyl-CoA thioester hydrolase